MSNPEVKYLKAYLNYNCAQGNNWITRYKFEEIASHGHKEYFKATDKGLISLEGAPLLKPQELSHIYFTYMTETLLITLVEMIDGKLYLIYNSLIIDDSVPLEPDIEPGKSDSTESSVVEFSDEMIQNYKTLGENLVKKVETVEPLPEIQSVKSKIIWLEHLKDLPVCLTSKELKLIGIRVKKWFKCDLKKSEQEELSKLSWYDFIGIKDSKTYIKLLNKYIKQSKGSLNLTHNYSVTPELLSQLTPNSQVKEIIIYQNFQIDDFGWLKVFPQVKLLNFWYCQQLEQKHMEQIVEICPDLEVFNLHSSCRVNLRILIPLFKLNHLQKLALDDPSFWCQKSIHELFVLPHEWADLYCPSLEKLALNSRNLSLDVLDYILRSCPNLTQLVIDDDILTMVTRNIIAGHDPEVLTVHSWQSPNKGFEINKKVVLKNLFKDTYNSSLFSESMLKKIKEHREQKNEPEPIPVVAPGEEKINIS